jgi:hypothetical protein
VTPGRTGRIAGAAPSSTESPKAKYTARGAAVFGVSEIVGAAVGAGSAATGAPARATLIGAGFVGAGVLGAAVADSAGSGRSLPAGSVKAMVGGTLTADVAVAGAGAGAGTEGRTAGTGAALGADAALLVATVIDPMAPRATAAVPTPYSRRRHCGLQAAKARFRTGDSISR